jgi:FtsP/CotA-like multicopper oxidase with cupredoxin domain
LTEHLENGMDRRAFLVRSGAAIGGGVLLLGGGLGVRSVFADAPAEWFEPAVRRSRNGRLNTRLLVAEAKVPIDGQPARSLTYESSYPGPTIDLDAGDELVVDLVNDGSDPTNLHTHGLHVTPQAPSDDVLLDIEPGDRYSYTFRLPEDHPGGTFWYHAHRHMLSDKQVFGGLFGMLVVRGELDRLPGVAGLEERSLILSQAQVVDGAMANPETSSLSDQVTLVNARYQPTVQMKTGETQRWRVTNTSSVFIRAELEGHELHPIAIDGNALQAPSTQQLLEIPPGGRVDLLVQAPKAGSYRLRSLSWKSLGAFYMSMVPNPQVLATLEVSGAEAKPDPLPTELLPFDDLADADVDRERVFRLEEREPRGVGPTDAFEYFINGEVFDASTVNVQVPLGATEEWEFRNLTYEPHPLHIHTNPFQVVAINGDRSRAEPHYRDSALVPPFGSLTIRHRFLDFTGLLVMHCHILFHEDHGMMQLIEIYGDEGPGPKQLAHPAMDHAEMAGSPLLCTTSDVSET